MKTSIATVSISGDLREKIAAIAAAGFDGVEIFENDFLAFDGSRRAKSGRMVRDHRPGDHAVPAFPRFRRLPEPQRGARLRPRRAQVRSDAASSAPISCWSAPTSRRWRWAASTAPPPISASSASGRRSAGLRVGYEALAWGRHINDHRDAWEIVRRADHPNIGLILDCFHTLARKIDVELDPRHSRRQDLHRPARRRAADRHGPALLEPSFPQHAGRRRPAGHRLHARGRGDRL